MLLGMFPFYSLRRRRVVARELRTMAADRTRQIIGLEVTNVILV